ncbi:MAG: hypothetical protein FGM17_05420 [Polynucleobacter sp.]|nr:hypothetical protein [Polynucleobacter sp.]
MRLIARLRQETGCHVPLRLLFTHPTPAGLAPQINQTHTTYNPLIPLRKSGSETPLFCVHPGGGVGTVYGHLMEKLDSDQPVWALQAKGLEVHEDFHNSIAEMASSYIAAIKEIQPAGPYRILGWSFGGAVGQEMAVQLEAQGNVVETIFMLDSAAKVRKNEVSESINIDPNSFIDKLLPAIAKDCEVDLNALLHSNHDKLKILRDLMVKSGLLPHGIATETAERVMLQIAMSPARLGNHVIQKCKAPIIFFRATEDANLENSNFYDWTEFTSGGVTNFEIQCRHSQMTTPTTSELIAPIIEKVLLTNKLEN